MTTKRFYDIVRPLFGTMTQTHIDSMELIIDECRTQRVNRQGSASVLATTFHETNKTMEPVEENLNYSAGGLRATFPKYFTVAQSKAYARKPVDIANRAYANRLGNGDELSGDGWRYKGGGFVQMTGRVNYEKFENLLGIPLVAHPELARVPATSAKILVMGMKRGLFTGVSLDDVSEPATSIPDFENDRPVVNGRDRAKLIAGYAEVFYEALADVDMYTKSRIVGGAKNTKLAADTGILLGLGKLAKDTTDILSQNPADILLAAQQGMTLSGILGISGSIIAVGFIGLMVYQRRQANKIETARREDGDAR